jgi:transposase-like protein
LRKPSQQFAPEFELREKEVRRKHKFFGARRVRGKRGHRASGKTIVFGLLKGNDQVYTEIVPDGKKKPLYRQLLAVV